MLGVALRISNFFRFFFLLYSSITARTESWADMETPLNVNHALAYIHTHIQAAIYNSLCVLSEGERERDMWEAVGSWATFAPTMPQSRPSYLYLNRTRPSSHSTAQPSHNTTHNTHNTKDDYAMTGNKLHAPSTLCWTALWLSLILIGITLLRLLRAYMCRHIHHHPVRREPPRKKKNIRAQMDGWQAPHFLCIGEKYRSSYFYREKKRISILSRLFVRSFFKYIFLLAEGGLCSPSAIVHRVYSRYNRRHLPLYISWRLQVKEYTRLAQTHCCVCV